MRRNSAIITGIVLSVLAISVMGTFGLAPKPNGYAVIPSEATVASRIGASVSAVAGVSTSVGNVGGLKASNGRDSIAVTSVSSNLSGKVRERVVEVSIINSSISTHRVDASEQFYVKGQGSETLFKPVQSAAEKFPTGFLRANDTFTGKMKFLLPSDGSVYTLYYDAGDSIEKIGVRL